MDEENNIKSTNIKPVNVTMPDAKKKMTAGKIIGIVIGSFIALIVAIFMIVMVTTDASVKVSGQFISDMQANKTDAAYALMSAEAKEATPKSDFDAAINRIAPILTGKPNLTSREIAAETGTTTKATIIYEITGTDSKTYDMTILLQENDSKWQVQAFQSIPRQ